MIRGPLLFRADASVATGTGHVMRCLALAQAWQDAGGRAVFAMSNSTPAVRERLLAESCEVVSISAEAGTKDDARQIVALARKRQADWVVVDGYQFTEEYQRALKSAGLKILFVDDYGHARHYSADLVLNQNAGAGESLYPNREPYTRLLLGTRYCMLRREFSVWREWRREISPLGHRVLVTVGGSDPENLTARAIAALGSVRVENLEAKVVVGGSNPQYDSLKNGAAQCGNIAVERDVTDMAELMAWADVAVSAAGSTAWELCLLGLPAFLIDVAPNQSAVARELNRRGCAVHLGGPRDISAEKLADRLQQLLKSEETRRSISLRSRELVDGEGAKRVVYALRGASLRLRPAQESDSRQLWEWANDPQVRATAFSSGAIPWEQHEVWFASKMRNPDCRILIAEDEEGTAIGQFRVNWRSRQEGEIDVSLSRKHRGAGYGGVLIDLGVSCSFAERGEAEQLHAFVKPENQASRRAFELAGFRNLGEETVSGHRAIHYIRTRMQQQPPRSM